MDNTICYLNTDLDLVSAEDLTSLAEALKAAGVFALSVTHSDNGQWYATFETATQFEEPEPNIAVMLNAVESLPESLSLAWAACTLREFNIGYDCGIEPWSFNQGLTTGLLERMAKVRASLRVTLYPDRPVNVKVVKLKKSKKKSTSDTTANEAVNQKQEKKNKASKQTKNRKKDR